MNGQTSLAYTTNLGPNCAMHTRYLALLAFTLHLTAQPAAQNLPVLLVRVANNWSVYRPDHGGGWELKNGSGKLSSILVGEKVAANTLTTYGSDQSVQETGCEFLFHSGSEAVLETYNSSDTEWELLRGAVTYSEGGANAAVARRRQIRVRGTKTSGRAGGQIVPKSTTPTVAYRVTMLTNATVFECIEGVMIVGTVEYTKGESVTINYP